MLRIITKICIPVALLSTACRSQEVEDEVYEDPGASSPVAVDHAVAVIHPTAGNAVHGTVRFSTSGDGVDVVTNLHGLEPGEHAHHIHIYGDCSGADGKTAGTHFNFDGPSEEPPETIERITGDLGDVIADASGDASAEHHLEGVQLSGRFSILGRSVIVHERANDPDEPPIGAAGGRLGCGVIGVVG